MIPGLLAASGLDRRDTVYSVIKADTVWLTVNGVPGGSNPFTPTLNLTNTSATPSDSRHVLVGIVGYDYANTNQSITALKINGQSADNLATNEIAFNAGTKSFAGAVGSMRIEGGNTIPLEITFSQATGSMYVGLYAASFDCGTSSIKCATWSDISADASQVLDVGDIGNATGCLVVYGFEDASADTTSVSITTGRTIDEQYQGAITSGMIYGGDHKRHPV